LLALLLHVFLLLRIPDEKTVVDWKGKKEGREGKERERRG
jgi:hypothetical protein